MMAMRAVVTRMGMVAGLVGMLAAGGHELRAQPAQAVQPVPPGDTGDAGATPSAAEPGTPEQSLPPPPPPPAAEPSAPAAAPAAAAQPRPTVDCRHTDPCRLAGLCTPWAGRCVAGSHEECAWSEGCRTRGLCRSSAGVCTLDACIHSEECRERGRCNSSEGKCISMTVAQCRASRRCASAGECMLQPDKHRCTDGTKLRSLGGTIGGAIALGVGGAGLIAGALYVATAADDESGWGVAPDDSRTYGIVAFIMGGTATAVGIPLLIWGAPRVADEDAQSARSVWQPDVRVGPTAGSRRWQW